MSRTSVIHLEQDRRSGFGDFRIMKLFTRPSMATGSSPGQREHVRLGKDVIRDEVRVRWIPRLVFGLTLMAIVALWRGQINVPPSGSDVPGTPEVVTRVAAPHQASNSQTPTSEATLGSECEFLKPATGADTLLGGIPGR